MKHYDYYSVVFYLVILSRTTQYLQWNVTDQNELHVFGSSDQQIKELAGSQQMRLSVTTEMCHLSPVTPCQEIRTQNSEQSYTVNSLVDRFRGDLTLFSPLNLP